MRGIKDISNSTIQTDSINFISVEMCVVAHFIYTKALNIHTLRDFVRYTDN